MKRGFLVLVLALSVGTVAGGVSAGVSKSARLSAFKSPSSNIICVYLPAAGGQQQAFVECGIKSGLKPPPPKSGEACKHVDYVHNRIDLGATGRAQPIACAGDAGALAYEKQASVLRYGQTFNKGGLFCSSHVGGMTCTNKQSHGFFLSRARWKKF